MTEEILSEFGPRVASLKLVPSYGGAYEVKANGDFIFSKKQTGLFPQTSEIKAKLKKML